MIKAKRRFEFGGHTFRITKQFSYEMSYEAFCQGHVEPEELIGKTVVIKGEYGYDQKFRVVEVANKVMAVPGKHLQVLEGKEGYVKRTYITVLDDGQERQWWYYWQRLWRGFDGSEMWNLDSKILDWLVPRLKRFAQCGNQGWPVKSKNGEIEYVGSEKITGQMAEGFDLLKQNYDTDRRLSEQEHRKINLAFNLFKKHFGNLWT